VYGCEEDFKTKSISFAIQVYKFANEMQIDGLTTKLSEFLGQPTSALDVFATFDLFYMTNNRPGLESCKKVGVLLFSRKSLLMKKSKGFRDGNDHCFKF
jgi:hypothetical protein